MFRILAIEDDHIVRRSLSRTLAPEGYEVILAVNATSGLENVSRNKPDLILLDVNLPDGNGIDLCRKIKEDDKLRHVPILILTGESVSVENRVNGLEAGAEDYIIKPFSPKELLLRIKSILKQSAKPSHS